MAGRIGFVHRQIDLPEDASQETVHAIIDELNADDAIDGILVQLPLPRHLDAVAAVERIDAASKYILEKIKHTGHDVPAYILKSPSKF